MNYQDLIKLANFLDIQVIETINGVPVGAYDCLTDRIFINTTQGVVSKSYVLLHELLHSTGNKKRVNRHPINKVGFGPSDFYDLQCEEKNVFIAMINLIPIFNLEFCQKSHLICENWKNSDLAHNDIEIKKMVNYIIENVNNCFKTNYKKVG